MTLFFSVRHYFIAAFQLEKREFKKRMNYWTHGVLLSNYSTICIALGKWWSLCALPLSVCLFFFIFFFCYFIRFSFQRVFYSLFAFFPHPNEEATLFDYHLLLNTFHFIRKSIQLFNVSFFPNQFYQLSWFAWWAF